MGPQDMLRLGSAVVFALALAGPVPANARDHHVPSTRLRAGTGETQRGALFQSDWTAPSKSKDGTCAFGSGDGPESYPEGLVVGTDQTTVRIRIGKQEKPVALKLWGWRAVDANGSATGPTENIDYTLKKRTPKDRRAAWVARFSVEVVGDYYIQMYGRWRESEGCGGTQQAWWSFHLSSV